MISPSLNSTNAETGNPAIGNVASLSFAMATRWTLGSAIPPTEATGQRSFHLMQIYPVPSIARWHTVKPNASLVGRENSASISLPDDSVSRRHAMLEMIDGGLVLVDLQSTNGTYVNDVRIQRAAVQSGDRVRFGNQIFKVIAERVRVAIASTPVVVDDTSIVVTASLGVVGFDRDIHENEAAFLDAADQCLYAAKSLGRNRICAP
jgi:hypothetical protein